MFSFLSFIKYLVTDTILGTRETNRIRFVLLLVYTLTRETDRRISDDDKFMLKIKKER